VIGITEPVPQNGRREGKYYDYQTFLMKQKTKEKKKIPPYFKKHTDEVFSKVPNFENFCSHLNALEIFVLVRNHLYNRNT
jgi:hypothetical protein